jgi:hypothetical protein
VVRDTRGISREYREREERDYAASLAVRASILEREQVTPSPAQVKEGICTFADNRLAGFTLGKLFLRYKADRKDPTGISGKQFNWGSRWCGIVHAHARVMGYRLSVKSPSVVMIAGASGGAEPEPDPEEVAQVRGQFSDCYNALMSACRDHGIQVSKVTYGVAIENWPLAALSPADFGLLRIGLNSLGTVLDRALTEGRE